MKYISLGNSDASNYLIDNLHLNEFDIFYPFDSSFTTISVVVDGLVNGWSKYLDVNNPQTDLDNDDLVLINNFYSGDISDGFLYNNAYQCVLSFAGINIINLDHVKELLQQRIDNFMNAINSTEDLTFIFQNNNGMFCKLFRDKQDYYYAKLLELVDVLKIKYNKTNVKIQAFFINQSFTNTNEIETHSLVPSPEYISDNFETNYDSATVYFRNLLGEQIHDVFKL